MPSKFSGLRQGLERIADRRAQKKSGAVDELVKMAQLKELGYDVQPQKGGMFGGGGYTLTQDPNFVSTKSLERQKLMNDLDPEFGAKKKAAEERALFGVRKEMFGSGSGQKTEDGQDMFIMDPTGKFQINPMAKPMSDTSASKFSAAQQSLENIKKVREMATPEKFGDYKTGFSKIRMANRLGVTNPESIMGGLINGASFGLAKKMFETTDQQKEFENNISTLIEGQLRARTGAAAPQQEIDREVSRILSSDDSLNSFLSKLSNSEKFVLGISEGIRPGSGAKFGQQQQSQVDPLEEEAQQAIANGADPQMVMERLQQMRARRG